LQGVFQKLQGEPILLPVKISNYLNALGEFSRLKEQGEFFGIAGKVLGYCRDDFGNCREKSSVELRMVGRVWRGRTEQRGLTLWPDSPRSRRARNPQSLQIVIASEKRLAHHARGIESS
jgi:hypothetical protein